MPADQPNKYRDAIEVLQRGREVLIGDLANEVLDRRDDLVEGGFLLNEFLESQGTRLHFLCLLMGQLEQSAEALDEATRPSLAPVPEAKPAAKRRPRAKKLAQQTSGKASGDEH